MLRIEDTDLERSSEEMVGGILDGLRWLGLDWDEGPEAGGTHGPYFQSERLSRYREVADRLVAEQPRVPLFLLHRAAAGRACRGRSAGRRLAIRSALSSLGRTISRACRTTGAPRAVRVRVPPGQTTFDDLVHGPITIDHSTIEDFVILRSDGQPTYQLSVVCDDIDMAITDVVRGDDHISNTPKQILLYRALGAPVPRFAHVPLILGPDKKRLSKRHGATSVTEYQRQGFLPEAMVNFLALLGWSPGGDQELFSRDELVERFTLEGISGGNAVFNPEKLEWFNQQYLMRLPAVDLIWRAFARSWRRPASGRTIWAAPAAPGSSACSPCSCRAPNVSATSRRRPYRFSAASRL